MAPFHIGLAVVLVVYLLLALFDVASWNFANSLGDLLQPFLPVVSNFRQLGDEGVRASNFIALSVLGFPYLVIWALLWAEHNRREMRTRLAVTPFSTNFGWTRKIAFSIAYFVFATGICWYVFVVFGSAYFSDGQQALNSQVLKYKMVLRETLNK